MSENLNFYNLIPKKYLKKLATYKNYKNIGIDLPIRAVIAGSSGTGKTNAILNIIHNFGAFNRFYLFVGDESESLYQFLIDQVIDQFGEEAITISNQISDMPEVAEFDPDCNNLVIIDDLINQRGNKCENALSAFTNGRKANVSILYVTQDFFKVNLTVRKNCKIVILTKFNDAKDLDQILMKYKQGLSLDEIRCIYNYAVDGQLENFFLIDTEKDGNERYRKNFTPIKWLPQRYSSVADKA